MGGANKVSPIDAKPARAVDAAGADRSRAHSAGFDPAVDEEFGERLARQIGANLSDDQEERPKSEQEMQSEASMMEAARQQDWKSKVAAMTHEERVEATLACLKRKNNQKEILSDLLEYCKEEKTEEEAEAFLISHKQFVDGHHSASKYLLFMERTGGLEEREYDCDGVLITDAMRSELRELGAPEEEIEDLAAEWRYLTTAAGSEALELFDPATRTREMLASQKKSRHASFRRLLDFCKTPRSLSEITDFMAGDPGLEIDERTGVMGMQPSGYIGKLDEAGALTWENGWKTTQGGWEVLETFDFE